MLSLGLTGTMYVTIEPQDGRKGIDGLAGIVQIDASIAKQIEPA